MNLSFPLGKYRDLLVAIALFVVLDLGILVFNVYASIQLERDAGRINAAGELRMYTQQITKAVLTLQNEQRTEMPIQTSMAQLGQGHAGFARALSELRDSTGSDLEFRAFGLDPQAFPQALLRVEREWGPLDEAIRPLVAALVPAADDVEIASNKAVARNIRLMSLADDLAKVIQDAARTKTERMRQIQALAILLALLNFVYIVFKFLRRLGASDRVAEVARRETREILDTVTEGLLLVGADGRIGGQFSASVARHLMRPVAPGQDFRQLLDELLDADRALEARTYLDLLFDPKVKPALLVQLDPLREVPIRLPPGSTEQDRYLSFTFEQVRDEGQVRELLVTVFDVTAKVRLQRELVETQAAARDDIDDLVRVLEQEPEVMRDFVARARDRLSAINEACREVRRSEDARALVREAARVVHGLKGEAGALGLLSLSRAAHAMEDGIASLLKRQDLAGEDLIGLAVDLARVRDQLERFARLTARLGAPAGGDGAAAIEKAPEGTRGEDWLMGLRDLAHRVADDLNKRVRVRTEVDHGALTPAMRQVLREVLPQLVRNAVAHGIEHPQDRMSAGKAPEGELRIAVDHDDAGGVRVTVADDGRGIPVADLRDRVAAATGKSVEALSNEMVLRHMFDDQVSSAVQVDEHAGRGVGLSLVRELARRAGATLRVATQPQRFTRFELRWKGEQ